MSLPLRHPAAAVFYKTDAQQAASLIMKGESGQQDAGGGSAFHLTAKLQPNTPTINTPTRATMKCWLVLRCTSLCSTLRRALWSRRTNSVAGHSSEVATPSVPPGWSHDWWMETRGLPPLPSKEPSLPSARLNKTVRISHDLTHMTSNSLINGYGLKLFNL